METNTSCQEIQARLSAYIDGELPPDQAAALARHIDHCPVCQAELARLEHLDAVLAALPGVPPGDLAARVLARLPVVPAAPPAPRWRSLALAACLLLGIFLGGRLGLDLHSSLSAPAPPLQMASLDDIFTDQPQGSLGTLLVTYDLENGNGQ